MSLIKFNKSIYSRGFVSLSDQVTVGNKKDVVDGTISLVRDRSRISPGGGVLRYMGYIGMCRCEGYDFQAVYSKIGYINQSVWI